MSPFEFSGGRSAAAARRINDHRTDVTGAVDRYVDPRLGREVINIVVGGCVVTDDENVVIATTLGSCVAACIFDPDAGIGGMNHFLLPDNKHDRVSASSRYGSAAMENLINLLLKETRRRDRLRAKIFGGANVNSAGALRGTTVGQRNIEFVMEYLATEGIPTVSWDVGGSAARAIRFFPTSGRTQRRLIGDEQVRDIARSEASFLDSLKHQKIEGSIELF